jgi:CRP-like cAMP-binding protein
MQTAHMPTAPAPDFVQNKILSQLPSSVLRQLEPALSRVQLEQGRSLERAGEPITHVYFLAPGTVVSLLAQSTSGSPVEVGVIGGDGMLGYTAFVDPPRSIHQVLVQIASDAWRLPATIFKNEFDRNPALQQSVLGFICKLIGQISQTALCNRLHSAEERLARWLLVSSELAQANHFELTHEALANMLGTRRTTISLTAAVLQRAGIIRYNRGVLRIADRTRLQEVSCECYEIIARLHGGTKMK